MTSVMSRTLRRNLSTVPSPQVIFSGIQPTGVPHLGNYLGALQPWVNLQNTSPPSTKLFFSIVDLHAITVPQDPVRLARHRKETLATLLAIGLDPARSTIFYQSSVSAHSELMWILSCLASAGYLNRMTQWKSKLDVSSTASLDDQSVRGKLKLGLFSYPVLQAADILLYKTTTVPVGLDQSQHLEFTRELATNFNSTYTPIFVKPSTLLSPAPRINSLLDPTQKMSKSAANPKSRILLTDSREVIFEKVKGALTDSLTGIEYDGEKRPGIANLIDILHNMSGEEKSVGQIVDELRRRSLRELKERVAEAVDQRLEPIREKWEAVMAEEKGEYLRNVEMEGARRAGEVAQETMREVREAVGFGAR